MKRIAGVYLIITIFLLLSACSSNLLTINPEQNKKTEEIDGDGEATENDEEETIVQPLKEVEFEEMSGSFVDGEVILNFSLNNEDNLDITSFLINGELHRDFESNNKYTEITLKIDEGLNVGNKIYELQAIYYGNEVLELEKQVVENNIVLLNVTLNINGYEFLKIPQYPMDYIRVTSEYHSKSYFNYYGIQHKGIDMGGTDGGSGEDGIFSIADGEVVHFSNSSTAGKYIVLKHNNLIKGQTVITRYLHLAEYESFRIGDIVKKGQILGLEGDTGKADGVHLHFEMWIAPSDYNYNFYDLTSYAVDPIQYLFLHNYQTLSDSSLEKDIIIIEE